LLRFQEWMAEYTGMIRLINAQPDACQGITTGRSERRRFKAATLDRFDPHFILERDILTDTSDKRFYKLPQFSRL
jgi:hypothetical protein